MDLAVQIAGFTAALVSVLTFIPQAVKVWQLRHDGLALEGVSRIMLWCLVVTQTCWAIYGVGLNAIWTVIPSLFVMPLVIFMLVILHRAPQADREIIE